MALVPVQCPTLAIYTAVAHLTCTVCPPQIPGTSPSVNLCKLSQNGFMYLHYELGNLHEELCAVILVCLNLASQLMSLNGNYCCVHCPPSNSSIPDI